ncbi:16S rRNA (cytidine(1402)-2'-O)-methyltransferase [Eubacterium xylanophilum]|uniref:16S rRNA (cytidine(1402)-2'-O)-methyltransferase n=1 Tax=Eubacterium xylanophilum TaxID=39497 RepID=UPI00047D2FC4|nr:16S rRNA (cytidine(1402)-2'-O)-methyltransferase [Eubacterium xylanophilum]MCR5796599.1 16S rRNA (cytidine(1402)-2'-O)-methyltransferase [Eubacterium sp.]
MGKLYLCATPIGNLEDITLRVLRILKEVDIVAAEDTRQTIKLLNHYDIKTSLTSYHEHNKNAKTPVLVKEMLEGKNIALVTDAGTPAISDPGADLALAAYEAGIEVTSLPGAAAVITALTLSGLSTRRFAFEGFLPVDKKERKVVLENLRNSLYTTVFYEAPHRLLKTLELLREYVGEERKLSVCRELTKKHETVNHFTVGEAIAHFTANPPRGEFVLVVDGENPEKLKQDEQRQWEDISLEDHMALYENKGISRKEAMKLVANDRGISKNQIYKELLKDK